MCLSKPNIKQPDPVQEVKPPDITSILRSKKKGGNMVGGTLMTGPSGVDNATTGTTTLLGG